MEEKIGNNVFLNFERTKREEYEVTDYSIDILQKHYSYLNKDNYCFKSYQDNRRQMSSPGAFLESRNKNGIDIVGDILTSYKDIENDDNIAKCVKNRYKLVYHSIGNILPIPEGANYGGKKTDNYYCKLNNIKEWLERKATGEKIVTKDEEQMVINRLNTGLYLSAPAKGKDYPAFNNKIVMRYWLAKQRYFKTWKNYVIENYLVDFVDFVDDNFKVKEFSYQEQQVDKLVEYIICRNYRILHSKKMEKIQYEEEFIQFKDAIERELFLGL